MNYQFDVDVAQKLGVEEAIMVQNLAFWIAKNKANKKGFHDGRYWTYNSATAFALLFPFWTAKQVRRVLDSLLKKEVIVHGCYNKSPMDRTSWYAFTDEWDRLSEPAGRSSQTKNSILPNGKVDHPKREDLYQIENTDSKTDTLLMKAKTFSPPSLKECREEAVKKGVPEDQGEAFFDHHEARGWRLPRGGKIVDWHAAFRTWIRMGKEFSKAVPGAGKKEEPEFDPADPLKHWPRLPNGELKPGWGKVFGCGG